MKPKLAQQITTRSRLRPVAINTLAAALVAVTVIGCRHFDEGPQVAGWSIADPAARHPILVSQQPSTLSLKVPRGAGGLSPHQRAQVVDFLDRYRTLDSGNSKLVVSAPSGGANEVAVMAAVAEIRHMMRAAGFDETSIAVEAYHEDARTQAPVRISYLRFVAEGPQCGSWPTNLADDPRNLPHPNLGCATQRNFAAMVANPADLVGPRTETPSASERRSTVWEKYVKGDSTIARKQDDERVQVKAAN